MFATQPPPPPHPDEVPSKSEIDTGSDTSDGELEPPAKDVLPGHCKDDGVADGDESADKRTATARARTAES